ncbi:MOSC domain-containing protein [Dermatophilus congolensis]
MSHLSKSLGWVALPLLGQLALTSSKIPRCRMIGINQDGTEATGGWLKPLALERNMSIGVYANVMNPGRIHVGEHINVCQS